MRRALHTCAVAFATARGPCYNACASPIQALRGDHDRYGKRLRCPGHRRRSGWRGDPVGAGASTILRLALLEKRSDVADATSKANSGIAHTGFDSKPGTLESASIVASNPRWDEICDLLEVPLQRCGAIMVALSDDDLRSLEGILAEAHANGVHDVRRLSADEVRALEPNLNPATCGGLLVPRESFTSSALLTIAYAESAVLNGAQVFLQHSVTALQPVEGGIDRYHAPTHLPRRAG